MAGNAAVRGPVARPVAEVAEDPAVRALQRPGMPGFFARERGGAAEGQERTSPGLGVTHRAGPCEGLA